MIDYRSKRYSNRNPYFEAMLKEGTNTSPIGAHSQGWSRLAHALLAGLERGQMDREEREARERTAAMRKSWQPQQGTQGPASSPKPPTLSALAAGDTTAPQSSASMYPDWLRPYQEEQVWRSLPHTRPPTEFS